MLKPLRKIFARNTLYFPGCLLKNVAQGINENYQEILKKLGISFLLLDDFLCCGSPALNAGFVLDFFELRKKNLELLDKYGIGKIITPCPACFKVFSKDYELKKRGIEVEHVSQTIAKNSEKLKRIFSSSVSYHDPCHLGRHCNVYEEPRKIIKALGFKLVEFEQNRNKALCCGAGAGVKTNFPEIAENIAKKRIGQCKTGMIITTCPLCYLHLKENSKEKEIKELSEVLKNAI